MEYQGTVEFHSILYNSILNTETEQVPIWKLLREFSESMLNKSVSVHMSDSKFRVCFDPKSRIIVIRVGIAPVSYKLHNPDKKTKQNKPMWSELSDMVRHTYLAGKQLRIVSTNEMLEVKVVS